MHKQDKDKESKRARRKVIKTVEKLAKEKEVPRHTHPGKKRMNKTKRKFVSSSKVVMK